MLSTQPGKRAWGYLSLESNLLLCKGIKIKAFMTDSFNHQTANSYSVSSLFQVHSYMHCFHTGISLYTVC